MRGEVQYMYRTYIYNANPRNAACLASLSHSGCRSIHNTAQVERFEIMEALLRCIRKSLSAVEILSGVRGQGLRSGSAVIEPVGSMSSLPGAPPCVKCDDGSETR
jgi:hypothetical protein